MQDLGSLVEAVQGVGYFVAAGAAAPDGRPVAVVEAERALRGLRAELDRVIASLAA